MESLNIVIVSVDHPVKPLNVVIDIGLKLMPGLYSQNKIREHHSHTFSIYSFSGEKS